ncbi:hypothetical protein TIFTF001_013424 [Ficus carica]|uniref:LRAT domain-containing protein n=1 Tax=Ficus carica TaxID=3494 RepID=A0AA88D2V6_FICCA|nr:hypothetical protein TIFTF001_013424 [Ficus carica]
MVKIDKSMIKPGDHIYSYRNGHAYSHHGIYVGGNMVIHFTRTKQEKLHKIFKASSGGRAEHRCEICGYESKTKLGVVKTCLDCFLVDHGIYLFQYNVSKENCVTKRPGTYSMQSCDTSDVVIRRATGLLDGKLEFGHYSLFRNNCESFALFCTTGKAFSAQVLAACFVSLIIIGAIVL